MSQSITINKYYKELQNGTEIILSLSGHKALAFACPLNKGGKGVVNKVLEVVKETLRADMSELFPIFSFYAIVATFQELRSRYMPVLEEKEGLGFVVKTSSTGKKEFPIFVDDSQDRTIATHEAAVVFCYELSTEINVDYNTIENCTINLSKALHQALAVNNSSSVSSSRHSSGSSSSSEPDSVTSFVVSKPTTLLGIYKIHRGYASHKWDGYFKVYEEEFSRVRDHKCGSGGKCIRLLEIGVYSGGNLQVMKKYFGPNSEIVGLDIDPTVCELQLGDGIYTYCFDQSDRLQLQQLATERPFDIVVDDGSHHNADVIHSFISLFGSLNPGGLYIVEDTHTAYMPVYGGGLRNPGSAVEFFKFWVDCLSILTAKVDVSELGEANAELADTLCYWIESVKFVDSMVVVRKLETRKEALGWVCTGDAHLKDGGCEREKIFRTRHL